MKKAIITSLLFLLSVSGFSQTRLVDEFRAAEQISSLKDGALIVRLSKRQRSIDHLIKLGYSEKAAEIRKEQSERNKKWVSAFNENFNFCKVYFIYSEESYKVIEGNLNDVNFLDSNLEVNNSITFTEDYFLTAEYGPILQDTLGTSKRTEYFKNTEKGPERKYEMDGGAYFHDLMGFVVKDQKFIQLIKPFPYYVKENVVIVKRDENDIIKNLNGRLSSYYAGN